MNAILLLLAELLMSLSASVVIITVLSPSLSDLLKRLCPDEQAARFWTVYTKLMLVIAPMLLVLLVDIFSHFNNPLDNLRLALIAAISGILLGVHLLGKRLGQFILIPKAVEKST